MRRLLSYFVKTFIQGLLLLTPIVATLYVLYSVFQLIDSLIPADLPKGLGFLIVVTFVFLVGTLDTGVHFVQYLFDVFDRALSKTPVIKYIYTSIKDITNSFVGSNRKFNKPVWLKTQNQPEMWRIGFLTQKDMTHLGMEHKVAVYLPHSYAISGWVVIVDKDNIKPATEMTAAEALKFAVSGGITTHVDHHKEEPLQHGA